MVHLRHFCETWRQPFQKDYTESSVTHSFEQLLALRADLEEVLHPKAPPAPAAAPRAAKKPPVAAPKAAAKPASPKPETSSEDAEWERLMQESAVTVPQEAPKPKTQAPLKTEPVKAATPAAAPPPAKPVKAQPAEAPLMDADKCLEAIWEQLIAAPPSRGRSMSTIVLKDTKVLLSSWEVSAFVTEGGQEAEDLRRAVVARALLSLGADQKKRSGNETALAAALELARSEFSYFQGRVEQAKASKNTEAAVNLGISTKRLLSFIEETEKLRS